MSNGHFFRVEPDQARVEIVGHMFEAQCHVVEPIDERLEMVEIASRNRCDGSTPWSIAKRVYGPRGRLPPPQPGLVPLERPRPRCACALRRTPPLSLPS